MGDADRQFGQGDSGDERLPGESARLPQGRVDRGVDIVTQGRWVELWKAPAALHQLFGGEPSGGYGPQLGDGPPGAGDGDRPAFPAR